MTAVARRVRRRDLCCSFVAAALLLGACGGDGDRARDAAREPDRLNSSIHAVGAAAWGVAVDEGVWVSDPSAGVIAQLDGAGSVIREIPTGAPDPRDAGIAIAGERLWVANLGGSVGVLDAATGESVGRVDVGPGEPADVAVADGYAWVPLHGSGGGLAKVDAEQLAVVARVALPESAFDVAIGGRSVWVAGLDRRVFEIDAATGAVQQEIDVGAAPRGIAVTGDAVWVTLRDDQELVRIDPRTGEVVARVALDGQPWPVAAVGDAVWVADLNGRVTRIDARRNAVTGRANAAPQPRAIAVGLGAVWVASQTGRVARVALDV